MTIAFLAFAVSFLLECFSVRSEKLFHWRTFFGGHPISLEESHSTAAAAVWINWYVHSLSLVEAARDILQLNSTLLPQV